MFREEGNVEEPEEAEDEEAEEARRSLMTPGQDPAPETSNVLTAVKLGLVMLKLAVLLLLISSVYLSDTTSPSAPASPSSNPASSKAATPPRQASTQLYAFFLEGCI